MSFAEKLANVVNRHDEIQRCFLRRTSVLDDLVRMNKEISELARWWKRFITITAPKMT